MRLNGAGVLGILSAVVAVSLGSPAARAQGRPATKDEAALVVEGIVREVFRSTRKDQVDYVVQLEITRSEAGKTPREPVRLLLPAPGDALYVHTSDRPGGGFFGGGKAPAVLPDERATVRAYLVPRHGGGWEGASGEWFDRVGNGPVAGRPNDPPPVAADPAPAPGAPSTAGAKSALATLGLSGEGLKVQGRFVLKVTGVERGGAAQRAGLEPGDVIVAANDKELAGLEQLDDLARRGGTLNLVVLDVNTGKGARVAVELGAAVAANNAPTAPADPAPVPVPVPSPTPTPAPAGGRKSLGISAEPVTIGTRTAMKVVGVELGSPSEKAGIEVGDVIVTANGVPVTGAEALGSALRKSGPALNLTIRDTRTGRDTPVAVNLGGPEVTNPNPLPADPRIPNGSGRSLGAVTELVFFDTEAAVKVTEVEPGSPAARAGLEPGDVIISANGTPVLHPNTLNEAVRKSGPVLKLVVVDPKTNRKTNVEVNMGN